ncbi:MAG: hypothetical protein K0U54_09030 [Bacteroidetes bacterium]|nr:hypothetical protein [Bacteroidota bacterium]
MLISDLSRQLHRYHFENDRDLESVEDRFLRNTLKALDFLYRTNILTITFEDQEEVKTVDIIDVLVSDTENNIKIIPGNRNAYYPELNSVMFYDTHGAVFRKNHKKRWFGKNKGYNSPVSLLSHELIHCYNELYETDDYQARKRDYSSRGKKIDQDGHDLSFPNAEEVFVIKMTNQVVKRLGEDKRSNYGRSYYLVRDVLSTVAK